jgi:hypothetical protein
MTTKIIILLSFLFLGLISISAQENKLNDLRSWIGKYPTDKEQNFFQLPEIKKPLKELLSSGDFQHLTKELILETPIENVKNYLLVEVSKEHCSPCDNAMLVINLENSEIWVGFYKYSKNKSVIRWFSSNDNDYYELPKEILDEFLYIHEAKQ